MMQKGKLIHCNGIVDCIEPKEEGYRQENGIDINSFRNIFFKDFELNYILDIALAKRIHFHIATHTKATSTCQEKADITGLPLERVIKGYYLQDNDNGNSYGLMIPGNKTYNKYMVASFLNIKPEEVETRISRSKWLPVHIEAGTVHPFVNEKSFNLPTSDGKLEKIIFDERTIEKRDSEGGLDDFSFTAHPSTGYDNHRLSIQINYSDAFRILSTAFPKRIFFADIV